MLKNIPVTPLGIYLIGISITLLRFFSSSESWRLLDPAKFDVATEAFFFLILTFMITERFHTEHAKQKIISSLDQIKDLIIHKNQYINVEFIGTPNDAIDRVVYNTSKAISVKNTFILNINQDQKGIIAGYDRESAEKVLKSVCGFVKKEKKWIDIISEQGTSRVDSLKKEFNKNRITNHASYHCYKMKHDVPIINFIITSYSANEKEVLFGWGLHTQEPLDFVFSSTDLKIVGIFERYFQSLAITCGDEIDLSASDSSPQLETKS